MEPTCTISIPATEPSASGRQRVHVFSRMMFEVFSDNSRPLVQLGVSVKLEGGAALATVPVPVPGLIDSATDGVSA